MNPTRGEPAFLVPLAKYFSVRVPITDADLDAARRSMSCHRTQYSEDAVQRIVDLERRLLNGVFALVPLFEADAGSSLFRDGRSLQGQR